MPELSRADRLRPQPDGEFSAFADSYYSLRMRMVLHGALQRTEAALGGSERIAEIHHAYTKMMSKSLFGG